MHSLTLRVAQCNIFPRVHVNPLQYELAKCQIISLVVTNYIPQSCKRRA